VSPPRNLVDLRLDQLEVRIDRKAGKDELQALAKQLREARRDARDDVASLRASLDKVDAAMTKVLWTLIAFALTIAGSAIAVVLQMSGAA